MRWLMPTLSATSLGMIGAGIGITYGVGYALIVAGGLMWLESVIAAVLALLVGRHDRKGDGS